MAEAGCTPREIQAITGHEALSEVELYTRDVRQKLLAEQAITRWVGALPEQAELDRVA